MTENEKESNDEYEIEDFATQKSVFVYVENKGPDIKPTQVLGRFVMHPSLKDDVEMLINLTWN